MKTTLKIINEEVRNRAIAILQSLPLDGPIHELVIREYKKDRSAAQRGLYWIWITQIAGQYGELKLDVHRRMKKKHLIPIYMADPDSGMTETVMLVRDVYKQGMKDAAKSLEERITNLVSTNDADVKQFAEYLNQIEIEAIHQRICLVHPGDLWHEAMT